MSENKKRNKTDLEDSAQIWYFEMANPLWYILIICGMTYVSVSNLQILFLRHQFVKSHNLII